MLTLDKVIHLEIKLCCLLRVKLEVFKDYLWYIDILEVHYVILLPLMNPVVNNYDLKITWTYVYPR